MEKDSRLGGAPRFKGLFPDLMKILQERLNFTTAVMIPDDGEYGRKVMNGSEVVWTGIAGDLAFGKSDIRHLQNA